jgi:hypothetical protein
MPTPAVLFGIMAKSEADSVGGDIILVNSSDAESGFRSDSDPKKCLKSVSNVSVFSPEPSLSSVYFLSTCGWAVKMLPENR